MLNEALLCLEEGIVDSPSDGDLAAIFGLGFPPFSGGPFRHIDAQGPEKILKCLMRLQETCGERFAPAPILREYAEKNRLFHPAK